jgi:hypothetical protein
VLTISGLYLKDSGHIFLGSSPDVAHLSTGTSEFPSLSKALTFRIKNKFLIRVL